jgi:hypothetical protein
MRNGIFSFYVRYNEIAIKGIALVENDAIRGFSRHHVYSVERLIPFSVERFRKDRNTHWRVQAVVHRHAPGVSASGFPATLVGEEGEDQFWYEGNAEADRQGKLKVEIQGAWLHDFPWRRAAGYPSED